MKRQVSKEHLLIFTLSAVESAIYEYLKEFDTATGIFEKDFVALHKKTAGILDELLKKKKGKLVRKLGEEKLIELTKESYYPISLKLDLKNETEKQDYDFFNVLNTLSLVLKKQGFYELDIPINELIKKVEAEIERWLP